MEKMELNRTEVTSEITQTTENIAAAEIATEQQEMDAAAQNEVTEAQAREQSEMDAGAEDTEKVGYSSSYWEHEMAVALKNGERIRYDNAKNNWAKEKARESCR